MNIATRIFSGNNHPKTCRSLLPRIHTAGWQETHTFQKKGLKNSTAPIIIIGDSFAAGLKDTDKFRGATLRIHFGHQW